MFWDFPGGTVVKNLPANAEDTGSSPDPCPHATEQLSPCATTSEARAPRARQQEKPPQQEARALQQRVAPARRN